MNLGGLFGQQKTLAKAPASVKVKQETIVSFTDGSKEVVPAGTQLQLEKARARKKPGDFGIIWPKLPQQQVKDYKPILTLQELQSYLGRCLETGIAGFDWETTADLATRERFNRMLIEHQVKVAEVQSRMQDPIDRLNLAKDAGAKAAEIKAIEKEIAVFESEIKDLEGELGDKRDQYLKSPLDPWKGEICTVSLSAAPHEGRVIPIDHKKGKVFEPLMSRTEARKLVLDTLDQLLFRSSLIIKIAVNLAFETKYATKYGKYILMPVADPLVMWVRCLQVADPKKIVDPKKPAKDWGLKPATKAIFGVQMGDFLTLLKKHEADFFDELDASQGEGMVYSAEDSDYGVQHYLYWLQISKQLPNYDDWLHKIEMPFSRVIGLMEYHGIRWDAELAEQKRQEAVQAQEAAADEIRRICKEALDIDVNTGKSGKTNEIKHVLFDLMKLPAAKWGKTTADGNRNVSLDGEAIIDMRFMLERKLYDLNEEKFLDIPLPEGWEQLDPETDPHLDKDQRGAVRIAQRSPHPYKAAGLQLLEQLEKIQTYATLLSSHINGRQKYVNEVSGRIHANYSPWTETARLNSSKPNGQNVPRLENDVFAIRNFHIPGPGKILFFIDFSGFELRILAWIAEDGVMIELFNSGGDMHKKTAATLAEKPESEVTKVERTDAKPANFGIAYVCTEHSLQTTYKTDYGKRKTLAECAAVIDAVKRAYAGIPKYHRDIVVEARESGYVKTIYGFMRLLPDINSTNRYDRESAGRQAANTPIQGSAADVMKLRQNEVYDEIGRGTNLVNDANKMNRMIQEVAYERGEDMPVLVHGHTDMIAQIHDEMMFEIDDNPETVEAAMNWVKACMEKPPLPNFPVKIEAEASVGYAWGKKSSVEAWVKEKRAPQIGG